MVAETDQPEQRESFQQDENDAASFFDE